jgi:hypothetical protein
MYLIERCIPLLEGLPHLELLEEIVHQHQKFSLISKHVCMIFTYLDRYYVKYHKLLTMSELCAISFKDLVFSQAHIEATNCLIAALTTAITADDDSHEDFIDIELARGCVLVYNTYGDGTFEAQLFEKIKEYVSLRAEEHIFDLDGDNPKALIFAEFETTTWISKIVSKISDLTAKYIKNSNDHLIKVVEDIINEVNQKICHKLQPAVDVFKQQISSELRSLVDVFNASAETGNSRLQIILDFLRLNERYLEMVKESFVMHAMFVETQRRQFQEALSRVNDGPKHLSHFCDILLRSGGNKRLLQMLPETERSFCRDSVPLSLSYLDKSMELLRLLQDKDVFGEIYKNQFAMRLLNARSESVDFERFVIGKMKLLCGSSFTNQVEGMLNDLAVSKTYDVDFSSFESENTKEKAFEFSVTVLTSCYWPNFQKIECKLPRSMDRCLQEFSRFYRKRHGGTRLQWVNSLGSVEICASYSATRRYTIQIITIQAVVLMEFNGIPAELSIATLSENLGIDKDVVKRVLQSLEKFDVIKRISNHNLDSTHNDSKCAKFIVNEDFQYKLRKFSIPMPPIDALYNPGRICENRRNITEAFIVRKMKVKVIFLLYRQRH